MSGSLPRAKSDHVHYTSRSEDNVNVKTGIFIYAEAGAVFQGLVQSLERTFTDITIHLCSKFVEVEDFDEEIGLVLIHTGFVTDLSECTARCRKRFPNASITMMIDEPSTSLAELNYLFDNKLVQGLLPFSLKLDVWLAVIWLLLNGGEYYPSAIIRSSDISPNHTTSGKSQPFSDQINASGVAKPIKSLTIREHQILELLSEGLQNKIIADRLKLSEHTVKVHVHNLIRKLRVHNRTQAAAVYRNNREQETYQPPFRGYGASMGHMMPRPVEVGGIV
jgi:DNA-binding NarL/FixJ family response regulator